MYFSKLLLGFFSLFVSTPTHAGDFSYNEPSTAWANLPAGSSIPVERVRLSFSPDEVLQMQDSLKHARHSYLNSGDRDQNDWISRASDSWSEITVPNLETDLNRHPQFNASLAVDGQSSNIHFMALFSQEPAAIPIVLLHGWPGNVAEFSDLFDIFRSRYSPADCPFHLIVPSLPGYTFSSGNPILDRADLVRVTRTIDRFLADIGLDNGYIAHGGDIGSYIARMLGSYSSNCKAVHVDFLPATSDLPDPSNDTGLNAQDLEILSRGSRVEPSKVPYNDEHATKQAPLDPHYNHDPVSILAWLEGRFNGWVDPQKPLPMQTISTHASIYYLTRMTTQHTQTPDIGALEDAVPFVPKPFGYSRFPLDTSGVPRKWAAMLGDLVWFNAHERGGHFAAMERPEALWNDIEHFVRTAFSDDL